MSKLTNKMKTNHSKPVYILFEREIGEKDWWISTRYEDTEPIMSTDIEIVKEEMHSLIEYDKDFKDKIEYHIDCVASLPK